MRLTERTCTDCKVKFDLLQDKYYTKPKTNWLLFTLYVLVPMVKQNWNNIFGTKLVCEKCHRDSKLKSILKK